MIKLTGENGKTIVVDITGMWNASRGLKKTMAIYIRNAIGAPVEKAEYIEEGQADYIFSWKKRNARIGSK